MPPPKQNPIAPSLWPDARRSSSPRPARMSATNRSRGALLSAAIALDSSPRAAVPPSAESRSMASAE